MSDYEFVIDNKYSKQEIYIICSVPKHKQGGNWNTGYHQYEGDWFIFCNVGVAGRTGHDYENRFVGKELVWYGKNKCNVKHSSIQSMLQPAGNIFIFHRYGDRDPYTFNGKGIAIAHKPTTPVEITWSFQMISSKQEPLAEEIVEPPEFTEGVAKSIYVNVYERNPEAREACVARYGYICSVCNFDFSKTYGKIGTGFIHVHHLKPLSEIKQEYQIDPIVDLRPVCPNCHAMLHKRKPAYSIEELIFLIKSAKTSFFIIGLIFFN
jgi:5-methylcytosine-specific restriction enzyme A